MSLITAGDNYFTKRIMAGLGVIDVSHRLKMDELTIGQAEREPARVPLCDLTRLLNFYELTWDEHFEFCSIQIKPRNQS